MQIDNVLFHMDIYRTINILVLIGMFIYILIGIYTVFFNKGICPKCGKIKLQEINNGIYKCIKCGCEVGYGKEYSE